MKEKEGRTSAFPRVVAEERKRHGREKTRLEREEGSDGRSCNRTPT